MATTNLSQYNKEDMPTDEEIGGMSFSIIVSDWNEVITGKLFEGAVSCLKENGVPSEQIAEYHVPGSFELVYAAAKMVYRLQGNPRHAVIVLGSVVRGGTPHFDYVCSGVTQGIAQLNAQGKTPVIFGLLTTDDMQQALDRAGGKLGNKGVEAAQTAIKMLALNKKLDGLF